MRDNGPLPYAVGGFFLRGRANRWRRRPAMLRRRPASSRQLFRCSSFGTCSARCSRNSAATSICFAFPLVLLPEAGSIDELLYETALQFRTREKISELRRNSKQQDSRPQDRNLGGGGHRKVCAHLPDLSIWDRRHRRCQCPRTSHADEFRSRRPRRWKYVAIGTEALRRKRGRNAQCPGPLRQLTVSVNTVLCFKAPDVPLTVMV